MHEDVLKTYGGLFNQKTVGFTIRRGDFLTPRLRNGFRWLTDEELLKSIQGIIDDNCGMVKIVVTSDDIKWCEEILKDFGDKIFYFRDKPENQIMALSFCDQVVNNGSHYRPMDKTQDDKFESTFGQIAQLLCISRHFLHSVRLDEKDI